MSTSSYRLGVDVGGTFTDATLLDDSTGHLSIAKVATTPADPSVGFLRAVERILRQAGVAPGQVARVVHATTVATNAIIEGKVARTAFLATEGFRDLLEIQRQIRPSLYDLHFEKPRPLVPRERCFGVPERLDARGQVLRPLDEAAVCRIAEKLAGDGVEAVAVCLLHAYLEPRHERRVGEILRQRLPRAEVSLSSDVSPEFREYTRASTTVVNAAIQPVVARYLAGIEARLRADGVAAELLVMQSNGGVYPFAAARERPVLMVESGPAAGVIAAAYLGSMLDQPNVISFDMGGTTAKAGLVHGGSPRIAREYEVGATARAGIGSGRGSGYPIRTPVVDLVEIGSGGGSIAWVDPGGALRVGPRSAGAEPGPACYGQGGIEPTVTDANLVLGRLNPDYFLGGEIALDVDRARGAIRDRCGARLGLDDVHAAHAIVEIANTAMANAIRLVSVQRGHDPREHALIAFGGAGPAHAARLAAETNVPIAIIPVSPGTFSALGLLITELRHDFATTRIERLDRVGADELDAAFARLEAEGRAALTRDGVDAPDVALQRHAELRYVGQGYELPVPVGPTTRIDELVHRFHREHDRAYGHSAPAEPVELVNLRVTAIGRIARPPPRRWPTDCAIDDAAKGTRRVFFAEAGGFVDCRIYERGRLPAGASLPGPAVVEELDSTTVVHPGQTASVDPFGNLCLVWGSEPAPT